LLKTSLFGRMKLNSKRITETVGNLKSRVEGIEAGAGELRHSLQKPPGIILRGGLQLQSLQKISDRLRETENSIQEVLLACDDRLSSTSLTVLLEACDARFNHFQRHIDQLENRLEQYGYDKGVLAAKKKAFLPEASYEPSTPRAAITPKTENSTRKRNNPTTPASSIRPFNSSDFSNPENSSTPDTPGSNYSNVSTPVSLTTPTMPSSLENSTDSDECPDITQDVENLTREIVTPGLFRTAGRGRMDGSELNSFATPMSKLGICDIDMKTPSLDDYGISSSTLAALQTLKPEKATKSINESNEIDGDETFISLTTKEAETNSKNAEAESKKPAGLSFSQVNSIPTTSKLIENPKPQKEKSRNNDSIIATIAPVTNEEMASLKDYLKQKYSTEKLNSIIQQINGLMAEKQFDQGNSSPDKFTLKELEKELGSDMSQAKAIVLILLNLKKLAPAGNKGESNFVYRIL